MLKAVGTPVTVKVRSEFGVRRQSGAATAL